MDKKFCKFCGEEIEKDSIVCPKCGRQLKIVKKEEKSTSNQKDDEYDEKSKFYAKKWFMWVMLILFAPVGIFLMWKFHPEMKKNTKIILTIVFAILFLIIAIGSAGDEATTDSGSSYNSGSNTTSKVKAEVEVIDFSSMQENEILSWCKENNLNCNFKREYSDIVPKDGFISQSVNASEKVSENTRITITYSLGKQPTNGQKNALKKAETYSTVMHMSKKGIYNQLTSEYGEGFTAEEAQYAIDNLKADWNANALATAKNYQEMMSMSKNAIYQQLTSEYGEGFTAEEAQYAIDHLDD